MNIKRSIDKNYKSIWYIAIVIIFILFIIKILNSYYEEDEQRKKIEETQKANNNQTTETPVIDENYYSTESDSIEKAMRSFVNYCNNREIENAYKMLTEECKMAMFQTIEDFERIYINNIYNTKREYELTPWYTNGDKYTYKAKLYGDILATGDISNYTVEYYTFVKDSNGNYKVNVNNYIYGEDRNIEITRNNITIKIGRVDIYEEYEDIQITVTNNSSKTISLTGNKYSKNIYLQNSQDTIYSSLNSRFENDEIVMNPNSSRTFKVRFNKMYNPSNNAEYIVFSDIILDYEQYLKSEDKSNFLNRTSIKMQYQN